MPDPAHGAHGLDEGGAGTLAPRLAQIPGGRGGGVPVPTVPWVAERMDTPCSQGHKQGSTYPFSYHPYHPQHLRGHAQSYAKERSF